jgi:Helicase associated domain
MSSPFAADENSDKKRAADSAVEAAEEEDDEASSAKRIKTEDNTTVQEEEEEEDAEAAALAAAAATDAAIGDHAICTRSASAAAAQHHHPRTRSFAAQSRGAPQDPATFNDYFFDLLAYKAETNNFHVTKEENAYLHAWLQNVKREYKLFLHDPSTSTLTAAQRKVLEHLHVPLTSRGDDHWNRFFALLKSYSDRHGHVLVPRLCETPGLGDWVTDQRRQYKAWKQGQSTQLSRERREKLEALGFAWQVRNRPEWEQRFQELIQYKQVNGDCKVPQHYKENKALGKWVAKQREQFKLLKKDQHSFLTPYRLEKLNEIGMVWQVRTALDLDLEDGDMPDAVEPSSGEQPAASAAVKLEEPTPVKASDGMSHASPVAMDAAAAAAPVIDAAMAAHDATETTTPTPLLPNPEIVAEEVAQPVAADAAAPNAEETAHV